MDKVPNAVEILPKISTNLSRAHERYRQTTDDRQTDDRQTNGRQQIANVNVSFAKKDRNRDKDSRSIKDV